MSGRAGPLGPHALHILVALADGARHGYGIKQEVEERTGGAVRLGPGTLYETIQRLEQLGLIVEAAVPANDTGERRRRYYRLTPAGLRVLKAEVARLADLVALARSRKALKPS
jgi:DNA-binding PadR family transcriptional regulator